jgi:hypothetical protein
MTPMDPFEERAQELLEIYDLYTTNLMRYERLVILDFMEGHKETRNPVIKSQMADILRRAHQ